MKWIGQHIYDLVARFRNDFYLEDLSTTTETNVLVVDSTGKVSKTTVITGDVTGVTAGSNITVTNPTGPVPTVALSTNVDVAGTLDVTSLGTFDASVTVAGNVGIGTTSLSAPLMFGKSVYANPNSENFYRIKFQDQGGITNDVGIGQSGTGHFDINFDPVQEFTIWAGTNNERLKIMGSTGNVGIGTTSPAQKLDVVGKISLKDAGDSIFVGYEAGLNDDASANLNVGVGYQALRANTTGASNSAHGYRALYLNTTGASNSAVGNGALYSNTTGAYNTAVGVQALYFNTTGVNNVAAGRDALYYNTTGAYNTAHGNQALYSNTTGQSNTAYGQSALYNNTTVVATLGTITGGSGYTNGTYTSVLMTYVSGSTAVTYPTATIVVSGGVVTTVTLTSFGVGFKDTTTVLSAAAANIGGTGSGFTVPVATISSGDNNTAHGFRALYSNTTGDNNSAVGRDALYSNTTGASNTAHGYQALYFNTTGASNTAHGYQALYNNTTGASNSAVGVQALFSNTTGANNSAVGRDALYYNTIGVNNTAHGYQALYLNTTGTNNSAVGYQALRANTTVVATLGTITGGSGYTNNTYTSVLMTYVSGSTAVTYPTATIVVSGGVVTTVTLTSFGVGFKDTTTVLSAAAANIGGAGSGFTVPVATISSGDSNTAIGLQALYSNTTGDNNSAVGNWALYSNTTGSSNTAIGREAGRFIADGTTANTVTSNSVFLGNNTKALAISQTNQIVIGDTAVGLGSNTAILGNSSITKTQLQGNVGIGTATPLNKLDIVGSLGRGAPVTKTTNFTVAATENWLIMNGTATITITLPTASSFTGRELMIKNIAAYTVVSASSNVKPIDTDTAATAILPATAGSWCTLVSDGTNWVTMMN